jgi:protoporphyrinogen oxidase
MRLNTKKTDVLVLGAGPAGLAAAYWAARAGLIVTVIDQERTAGGLMRSIRRGDFIVDVGRKELSRRIPSVCAFWDEILGNDMRPYNHRAGILFHNNIIEKSSYYAGRRCAMPWSLLLRCGLDYIGGSFNRSNSTRTYLDYRYKKHGRLLSQVLYQEFDEAFTGKRWIDLPYPDESDQPVSFHSPISGKIARAMAPTPPEIFYHPARGTGQIAEQLRAEIERTGGEFLLGARAERLLHSATRVESVVLGTDEEQLVIRPAFVISSLPLEHLSALLRDGDVALRRVSRAAHSRKRSTALVYLFLNEVPRFPHVWLEVTTPGKSFRRITNYAALNGEMVPPARTCLCVEAFCAPDDTLLGLDDAGLIRTALQEIASARLLDANRIFDAFVLRLPGADAAVHSTAWKTSEQQFLLSFVNRFENLYYVNRAGIDNAMYAGIEAAGAILSGDRTSFLELTDPTGCAPALEANSLTNSGELA